MKDTADKTIVPVLAKPRRERHPLRLVELVFCYFAVPALPLFGVPPRVFVPLFLVCAGWLTVVAVHSRIRRRRLRLPSQEGDHRGPSTSVEVITFVLFAVVSAVILWVVRPELLFHAPREQPLRWVQFWFIYSAFSVPPQEALFRVVFFDRYPVLWNKSRNLGLLLNAVSFSIAHAILHNWLVYALTFVGAYVFSAHWLRRRNFWTLWLLHGAYGLWLFTVGLGPVFGFPL